MSWASRSTPRRKPPARRPGEQWSDYMHRLVHWVDETDYTFKRRRLRVGGGVSESLQRLADVMGPRQTGVAWWAPVNVSDEEVLESWISWAQGGW